MILLGVRPPDGSGNNWRIIWWWMHRQPVERITTIFCKCRKEFGDR